MPLSGGRRKDSYRKAQPSLLLVVGGLGQLIQTLFASSLWNNKLKSSHCGHSLCSYIIHSHS